MPTFGTPYGTTQRYIPVVSSAQLGRYAGLHMHFATLAALVTAVGDAVPTAPTLPFGERANIADASPIWSSRQVFSVATEPAGVIRTWTIGVNAASSHAKRVILRPGLEVILANDISAVLVTSGPPSGGTGNNGDLAADYAANLFYVKGTLAGGVVTAGESWGSANAIYEGGGGGSEFDPPTGNPQNVPSLFTRVDNTVNTRIVFTRTFTSGVFHFNVGFNRAGQVVFVSPWGAGSSGLVEYPTGSGNFF